jgi:hypothetical protein
MPKVLSSVQVQESITISGTISNSKQKRMNHYYQTINLTTKTYSVVDPTHYTHFYRNETAHQSKVTKISILVD